MGRVRFIHDVYDRDERLIAALDDPPPFPPEPDASALVEPVDAPGPEAALRE